ncbi:RsmF rRNA methyltransferase first C-terminal domain-containing protein [Pediococcus argentinicus]|uniref:RsmB/NOP family class I SAM-dependent RNA methyltransferase n=1 Tax=Pediococcus argentinicus TaxID=480391 RepID=UPI0033900C66
MELPVDFKNKYSKLLGNDATSFFASFDRPVEKGFRINPLKHVDQLVEHSTESPISYSEWGYYGTAHGKTIDHQSGLIYSQEPSAMLVGEVAHPKPTDRVLDLCAAPGGKTTYLASFMDQEGLLVSNEINHGRAKVLAENVERFGIKNSVILNESPDRMEKPFKRFFDLIVVDAPCSGEGMFRKDPSAMDYWSVDYPKECANRQKKILNSALKMLKPGGRLVYSTCTFAPEEDEQIAAWMLSEHDQLELETIKKSSDMDSGRSEWADGNPELTKTLRLFPNHFKGEGHFIASFKDQRTPELDENCKKKSSKKSTLDKEHDKLWTDFSLSFLEDIDLFPTDNLKVVGEHLYYLNTKINFSKLKYIKPGLDLGIFKKNRFEPSLSLLMCLKKQDLKRAVTISSEQWRDYVHGEVITDINTDLKDNGWVAVCVDQIIVGPAKYVNGTLKNFYPKGLRLNF